ncbi:hypothetical protein B0H16DRAFT_538327 [Mycena metata]|uniref:Uncharacterized protein n=1 Tax=Mycena metata TaxID=1033252 RepID=A0AAD7JEL5_9AGAR|nr:hypothetical protein B0H16DRAFT_538327 [Mycena metata]
MLKYIRMHLPSSNELGAGKKRHSLARSLSPSPFSAACGEVERRWDRCGSMGECARAFRVRGSRRGFDDLPILPGIAISPRTLPSKRRDVQYPSARACTSLALPIRCVFRARLQVRVRFPAFRLTLIPSHPTGIPSRLDAVDAGCVGLHVPRCCLAVNSACRNRSADFKRPTSASNALLLAAGVHCYPSPLLAVSSARASWAARHSALPDRTCRDGHSMTIALLSARSPRAFDDYVAAAWVVSVVGI